MTLKIELYINTSATRQFSSQQPCGAKQLAMLFIN